MRFQKFIERQPGAASLERSFNIVLAVLALAVLALPLSIFLVAIKVTSHGPIFYRQMRVGRNGRTFQIIKLRTMEAVRCGAKRDLFFGDERRATRLGRVLRKWKIDELPQLINILRGEMNFVGPRPELEMMVSKYKEPTRSIVLSVNPGLTDFASIRFRHEAQLLAAQPNPTDFYERVILPAKLRYCRFYIRRSSICLDIYIIIQTGLALLGDAICEAPGRRIRGKYVSRRYPAAKTKRPQQE